MYGRTRAQPAYRHTFSSARHLRTGGGGEEREAREEESPRAILAQGRLLFPAHPQPRARGDCAFVAPPRARPLRCAAFALRLLGL